MKKLLLATTFVVAMAPAAFAGHADKDGPFTHANDNQIGSMTPYPGSPVVNTDTDGQITANFTTYLPGPPRSEAAVIGTVTEGLPANQITARRNALYNGPAAALAAKP